MGVYKYVLEETIFIETYLLGREFINEWCILDPQGLLMIKKGYAWDGCSPKIKILDLIIGTPDGKTIKHRNGKHRPITFYASCLHDVIYQFKGLIPINRKEADLLFLMKLKDVQFKLSNIYYSVVRAGGWIYGGW